MTNKRALGGTFFALAMIIGLTSVFTATAHADEWHDHGRDSREWHHRHHWHQYPVFIEQPVYQPRVIYRPVIIQAPEAEESSGFNITIPVNFN